MTLAIDIDLERQNFQLSVHTQLPTEGFTAIYGHSGAGKTTLLRWLAGLEKNTQGSLRFKQQVWQDSHHFLPTQQRQIGYVFQDARLFPHLDVRANLQYTYRRRFNNDGPDLRQVCQWFELDKLLARDCSRLSGGEQQRVAMARALLSSPSLLLMDEPLGSLDAHSRERILQHLENLHHQLPVPVLYVTHNLEEVSRLADQLVLLEDGKVSAAGPLLELSSRLDLSLSHEDNAASIIEAKIKQQDQHYQLTELLIDDKLPLYLTQTAGEPGTTLRVRIPARDVSITLQAPEQTSILNILPCTIDSIETSNSARVLLRLQVAEQFLLVRLTHKSVDRLQLTCGQQVYAQIKTVALLREAQ